ncbi:hypothetical protein GCM10023208_22060 [Erythrobacter westpacificensis]|uniref:Uncharacterized protein n=1 Tax=Erythrobacter westpacificensis TaxID=1055231 RepID=A0ABP9KE37_9SPHN
MMSAAPNMAPARVDWTRWEVPMAAPVNSRPGPAIRRSIDACTVRHSPNSLLECCADPAPEATGIASSARETD